jgi:hypothetical protein
MRHAAFLTQHQVRVQDSLAQKTELAFRGSSNQANRDDLRKTQRDDKGEASRLCGGEVQEVHSTKMQPRQW